MEVGEEVCDEEDGEVVFSKVHLCFLSVNDVEEVDGEVGDEEDGEEVNPFPLSHLFHASYDGEEGEEDFLLHQQSDVGVDALVGVSFLLLQSDEEEAYDEEDGVMVAFHQDEVGDPFPNS